MIEPNDPEDLREGVYANTFRLTGAPYDVTFDFGFRTPGQAEAQEKKVKAEGRDVIEGGIPVARVSMSWSHLKRMLPTLSEMIAQYEAHHGIIPAPGFGDQNGEQKQ